MKWGMSLYREMAAVPGLGLACVWTQSAAVADEHLVVPDGCIDIIAGLDGGVQVAGPDTGPRVVRLPACTTLSGVRFWPGAAPHVLGVPANALRDVTVELAEVWGPSGRRVSDGAADFGHPIRPDRPPGPIGTMQRAVAARLSRVGPADPAVAATARALVRGGSVAEAARSLGLSERQLRRRCLVAFGYGPKMLQRVLRFQRALALARSGAALADVAYAQGYADQAHLAHEVRELAGVPLGALR